MDATSQVQSTRSPYLEDNNKSQAPNNDMGKDAFLKILVAQLQNQDPLNPMEDKDFIAQMASFSSLEQMMKMSTSTEAMANAMDVLVQSQVISPVIQYSHMIGKYVSYQVKDDKTGETSIKSGKVTAVSQKDGWAILELSNGEKVYADAIKSVSDKEIELEAKPGKDESAT